MIIPGIVTMSGPIAGFSSVPTAGRVVGSSFVNTLENCLLKISERCVSTQAGTSQVHPHLGC